MNEKPHREAPATWRQALGDDPRPDARSGLDRFEAADGVARMAQEVGLIERDNPLNIYPMPAASLDRLARFANLVAAAEREACAQVCEVHGNMARHAVWMAEECAALIRARGQS